MYCKAIDGNAEAVMGARERGMSAQDIVSLTLQGARTRVMELLKPRG